MIKKIMKKTKEIVGLTNFLSDFTSNSSFFLNKKLLYELDILFRTSNLSV